MIYEQQHVSLQQCDQDFAAMGTHQTLLPSELLYYSTNGAHADDRALLLAGVRLVPAFLAQYVLADLQSTLSDARSLPE